MEGDDDRMGYSREEAFMVLLLAILIPTMVIATNFDLRPQADQAQRQSSMAGSVRIWLAPPEVTKVGFPGEAASEAVPEASALKELPTLAESAIEDKAGPSGAMPVGGATGLALMPINFSLPGSIAAGASLRPEAGEPLKVKKPIYAGARLIGNLDITIARDGELLLDAQDVRGLLGQRVAEEPKPSAKLPGQGPVSFAALREAGIDLRYSPHEDVLRLNP